MRASRCATDDIPKGPKRQQQLQISSCDCKRWCLPRAVGSQPPGGVSGHWYRFSLETVWMIRKTHICLLLASTLMSDWIFWRLRLFNTGIKIGKRSTRPTCFVLKVRAGELIFSLLFFLLFCTAIRFLLQLRNFCNFIVVVRVRRPNSQQSYNPVCRTTSFICSRRIDNALFHRWMLKVFCLLKWEGFRWISIDIYFFLFFRWRKAPWCSESCVISGTNVRCFAYSSHGRSSFCVKVLLASHGVASASKSLMSWIKKQNKKTTYNFRKLLTVSRCFCESETER